MDPTPCIYCRRVNVVRTTEHVLQKALGACATLPREVCGDCNAAFSAHDKTFVELVHFYYSGKHMLRHLKLGWTTLSDGYRVPARLTADGLLSTYPMLYRVSLDGEWRVRVHSREEFEQMRTELADRARRVIKTKIVPPKEGLPEIVLFRSAPNCYSVMSSDELAAADVVAALDSGTFAPKEPTEAWTEAAEPAGPPTIEYDTGLDLGTFSRVMAKIALNYVCYRLGAEVALDPSLDAIRNFARYGDGVWHEFVVPSILAGDMKEAHAAFFLPEHHGIYFWSGDVGGVFRASAFIVVDGTTVGRVDLVRGGETPDLSALWGMSRFNPVRKTVANLSFPEQMPVAIVHPEAIGMGREWPREWVERARSL